MDAVLEIAVGSLGIKAPDRSSILETTFVEQHEAVPTWDSALKTVP